MGTILGIIIGVAATILVARYYFQRSVNKSLGVFTTLSNRVFAGIEKEVKEKLEFHYDGEEIDELQQIDLIVANDGDKSIRDCIEPLSFRFKKKTKILDVSIVYRSPKTLQVEINQQSANAMPQVNCEFPLLNSGEFFMIKFLVDGYVSSSDIECRILVDDIPREFSIKPLPLAAVRDSKPKVEWAGVAAGLLSLVGVTALAITIWNYYSLKPAISPYPWSEFSPAWLETPFLLILVLGGLLMTFIGVILLVGIGFEDFFKKHPRFPLPEELRGSKYSFPDLSEIEEISVEDLERIRPDQTPK